MKWDEFKIQRMTDEINIHTASLWMKWERTGRGRICWRSAQVAGRIFWLISRNWFGTHDDNNRFFFDHRDTDRLIPDRVGKNKWIAEGGRGNESSPGEVEEKLDSSAPTRDFGPGRVARDKIPRNRRSGACSKLVESWSKFLLPSPPPSSFRRPFMVSLPSDGTLGKYTLYWQPIGTAYCALLDQ